MVSDNRELCRSDAGGDERLRDDDDVPWRGENQELCNIRLSDAGGDGLLRDDVPWRGDNRELCNIRLSDAGGDGRLRDDDVIFVNITSIVKLILS